VHVVVPPGANVVTGQLMVGTVSPVDGDVNVSATVIPLTVTLPEFVTANEYVTFAPAAVTVVGLADLTSVRAGPDVALTVAVDGGEDVTAGPVGGVPDAVAELDTDPLSISACVVVYEPVHVVDAPGARVVVGQEMLVSCGPAGLASVSLMPTPVKVTLPVLVTTNEYEIF
jgi:hypothetical protein